MGQLTETTENSDTSLLLHLDELPVLEEKTVKFSGRCEAVRQLGGSRSSEWPANIFRCKLLFWIRRSETPRPRFAKGTSSR